MKIALLFQSVRLGRGAFVLTLVLSVVPVLSVALAQELLPELAAPAAQHKAADEALDKQKLEAIALAAKSYVSALDGVEKAATAKGELDLVAAVVKEREAVASGALEPNLPAALPKARLQMSRKTLLASIERINADFAKRKKAADADYLRVLATIQPKAASNPELAKQLATEKAALLQGGARSGGAAAKVSRGKNVIVNGDFEKVGADGYPEQWDLAKGISYKCDNNNGFIRIDNPPKYVDGTAEAFHAKQKISVPAGSTKVIVSARIRTSNLKLVPKKSTAQVRFEMLDKNGQPILGPSALWDGKDGNWRTIQASGLLPKEGVEALVRITNSNCSGQIDFDDIEVTFK